MIVHLVICSAGDAGGAGSEDCLNVNVYTPATANPGDKRESLLRYSISLRRLTWITVPVLVYIHGGGEDYTLVY